MATIVNRQVRLAARPVGMPKRSDWTYIEEALPEPAEGQLTVKVSHLSLDPAMRGWMNEGKSYIRPVGIAGGAEKCRYLTEKLGFDAAIDYKGEDVKAALKKSCPDGIHVYFDNVGGDILDAALARLAMHARIVICGAISQYCSTEPVKGPANYLSLLVNRASMTGMVVFDYADRYSEAGREMAQWIAQGKLVAKEDVVAGGIDAF